MMSDKQREANRNNALLSTGPKTEEGVLACKGNALRHGLRSLQTVVPGEDPNEWEAHLNAVLEELSPQGAVETALAEQIAAKLWRLGRVVKHEAEAIATAQDRDVLRQAHEKAFHRHGVGGLAKTDIPSRADVDSANKAIAHAERKASEREQAASPTGLSMRQSNAIASSTKPNSTACFVTRTIGEQSAPAKFA